MSKHRGRPGTQVIETELLEALLSASTPVTPPAGLRAQVLERVRQTEKQTDFITVKETQGWKELIPGITVKRLCIDEHAGTKSFLLRAQAGMSLPGHAHQGFEECMVLEGEFTMGELTLRAGDYHAAPAGSSHPMASTATGVTVYLRAAIADYPGV